MIFFSFLIFRFAFSRLFKGRYRNMRGLATLRKEEFKNRIKNLKRNLTIPKDSESESNYDDRSNDNPFAEKFNLYDDFKPFYKDDDMIFLKRIRNVKGYDQDLKKINQKYTMNGGRFAKTNNHKSFN